MNDNSKVAVYQDDLDLGPANHHSHLCIRKAHWLPSAFKEILQKGGLWEDLMQEMYAAAFVAWQQGLDDTQTRKYAARCLYAFLKAYGFRRYRRGYYKFEKALFSLYNLDTGIPDRKVALSTFSFDTDHLDDQILVFLKEHPEGLPRRKLIERFVIPGCEVNHYLGKLIGKGLVLQVRQENAKGRPLTPLYFVAENGPPPAPRMEKTERDERIRHDYFVEGKGIKQIARELHHDKRTVRAAIGSPVRRATCEVCGKRKAGKTRTL